MTHEPFYRHRHRLRTRVRIANFYRWECDRLVFRAAFEAEFPMTPPPRLVIDPPQPPSWKVREGWQPSVLHHARECARILGINLELIMQPANRGTYVLGLNRKPDSVLGRWKVWAMMRGRPAANGAIPSFPEIAAVFGTSHTTVVEGVQHLKRRVAKAGAA